MQFFIFIFLLKNIDVTILFLQSRIIVLPTVEVTMYCAAASFYRQKLKEGVEN